MGDESEECRIATCDRYKWKKSPLKLDNSLLTAGIQQIKLFGLSIFGVKNKCQMNIMEININGNWDGSDMD